MRFGRRVDFAMFFRAELKTWLACRVAILKLTLLRVALLLGLL
jgi:hypothetical protein